MQHARKLRNAYKIFGQKIPRHLDMEYRYRGWSNTKMAHEETVWGNWRLDSYDLQQTAVGYSKHSNVSLTICKVDPSGCIVLKSPPQFPTLPYSAPSDTILYLISLIFLPLTGLPLMFLHVFDQPSWYRIADKSLARPGSKQARKHIRDARDFNNIETRAVIKFLFLQGKALKEIHAILTETLACFLPGRAKDLSAPLYNDISTIQSSCMFFCAQNSPSSF